LAARSIRRERVFLLLARPEIPVRGPLRRGAILPLLYLLGTRFPSGRAALEHPAAVPGIGALSLETVFGRAVAAAGDGVARFGG
jgi:hypothetical protein